MRTDPDDDLGSSSTAATDPSPSVCVRRRAFTESIEEDLPSNSSSSRHSLFKRVDRSDVAVKQLRIISQPKDNTDIKQYKTYTYDDEAAGKGITVYVIDTGANPKHNVSPFQHELYRVLKSQEFKTGGTIRWLYAGDNIAQGYLNEPGDYDEEHGHGPCITGVINSPTYGVSKNADLVIVKTAHDLVSDTTAAFTEVYNDIERLKADTTIGTVRPVINLSRSMVRVYKYSDSQKEELKRFHDAIEKVIKAGRIVVVSSGNEGGSTFTSRMYEIR